MASNDKVQSVVGTDCSIRVLLVVHRGSWCLLQPLLCGCCSATTKWYHAMLHADGPGCNSRPALEMRWCLGATSAPASMSTACAW
jgi:hypothetical protein